MKTLTHTLITSAAALMLVLPSIGSLRGHEDPLAVSTAQDAREAQPEVVTRVYSLRPLVQEARAAQEEARATASPFGSAAITAARFYGQGGGQRGGQQGDPVGVPAAAPTPPAAGAGQMDVVDQVIRIVTETIDLESWKENGGEVGSITYLPVNSRLVVTHTPAVQGRVGELLAALQDRRVVSTQARLVRLAGDQVAQNVKLERGVAVWQGEPDALPQVAQVRYSGFDGQTQTASDGQSVAYFVAVTPVVAAGSVGYEATLAKLNTGLTLRITPVLNEEGSEVTLEVSAEYALLPFGQSPATRPSGAGEGQQAVLPDRLTVDRQALDVALRVPTGRWVLVGSLGASRDGEINNEEPLHLLIRIDAGDGGE